MIVACSLLALGLGGAASAAPPEATVPEAEPDSHWCGFSSYTHVNSQTGTVSSIGPGEERLFRYPGSGSVRVVFQVLSTGALHGIELGSDCDGSSNRVCQLHSGCSFTVTSDDWVRIRYGSNPAPTEIYFRYHIG